MEIIRFKRASQPVIESERLLLREFRPEDSEACYRNFTSDAEVAKYMLWETSPSPKDTRERILGWIEQVHGTEPFYNWAITEKGGDGFPIGSVILGWIDEEHCSAELVYMLGRAYQGKGYMTEAVKLVLDFAFDTLGLNRVRADCFLRNRASARVMEKSGMLYEGIERSLYLGKEGFEDLYVYAITRRDYRRDSILTRRASQTAAASNEREKNNGK